MESLKAFSCLSSVLATVLVFRVISVNGQISTSCTASMISSFTPCLNFITGSTGGSGATPTAGCCNSIRSLMSTSMDCTCLLVTGNVPFSLPINQTLSISLPRACNGGVPLQCHASGVPLPAPGPVLFGPTPPPVASSPFSPRASKEAAAAEAMAPADAMTPASPPVATVAPTANPGIRPVVNPPAPASASSNPSSYMISSSFLLLLAGVMLFNFY